jgi:hypothetical protein
VRHPDGTRRSPCAIRFNVDVYEGGFVVRQAFIVRQDWTTTGQRCLWDEDGRCYSPRLVGLGVEEVEPVDG